MKSTAWLVSMSAAVLVGVSGVGCSRKATQAPRTIEEGVTQLRSALAQAGPEVRSNLYSGVSYSIRYGRYTDALAALNRIAGDASLDGQQRKLVKDVTDLLKQAIQDPQHASPAAL